MKTVFVTGVSKGLGQEFFRQLTGKGHFVFGLLRNSVHYGELQAKHIHNAIFILADVASDECTARIREVVKEHSVDQLINNAGIGAGGMCLDDANKGEIMALPQVLCLGALRVVQALKDSPLRASSPVVLNLNSRFGSISMQYDGTFKHMPASYAYRIAKTAQNG